MEEKNITKEEEKTSNENANSGNNGGFDMDEILLMSARQTEAKVAVQVKKQKFIASIVALEGVIALIAGICVIVLADMLAVGIPLLAVGVFIVAAVLTMNARTLKKLRLMTDRAKAVEKQIAEGKFQTKQPDGTEETK